VGSARFILVNNRSNALQAHLLILKRVGKVLIAVGLIDVAVMIYCIASGISYTSSFNVFALIGGIFLVRGNLRAAGIITWFTAFLIAALACAPFLFPLLQPLDYIFLQLRLYPGSIALSAGLWVFAIVVLAWVLTELRHESVLEVRTQSGKKIPSLRMPVALGFLLVVILAVVLPIHLNSEASHLAQAKVSEQFGPNYKYFVNSLQVSYSSQGKVVTATVTVYNDHEIHIVPLRWSEK